MSYMRLFGPNQANGGITKKKNTNADNLLHRGREVQGGREVLEDQAVQGYHRYQAGQEDPADGEQNRTKQSVIQIPQTSDSLRSLEHLCVCNL